MAKVILGKIENQLANGLGKEYRFSCFIDCNRGYNRFLKPRIRECISEFAAKKEPCFMCYVFISSFQKQKAVAANARIKIYFFRVFIRYSFANSRHNYLILISRLFFVSVQSKQSDLCF